MRSNCLKSRSHIEAKREGEEKFLCSGKVKDGDGDFLFFVLAPSFFAQVKPRFAFNWGRRRDL